MQDRSVFISSCSRRQLARRRAARSLALGPLLATLVVVIAVASVFALRGGI